MKILVLNGSPKGEMSVTYHHVLFLEKHYKNLEFEYIQIGQLYKKLTEPSYIEEIIDKMAYADAVMWCYPVYTFGVPFQLMRLIESLMEHPNIYKINNTMTFQLSTSKHFYDVMAYNYVHQCAETMGMRHIKGHMADMMDLLKDHGRKQLVSFFDQVVEHLTLDLSVSKKYSLYQEKTYHFDYEPVAEHNKIPSNILIVYNGEDYSETLKHMILAYDNLLKYAVHLLDLSNVQIKGGCLGCLKCNFIGHCLYNDEFEKMHREKVVNADVIIYASDIKNHWFHSDFKLFHDRAFYNGHHVTMKDKAVGYLLVGPLRSETNLQEIIEARASVRHLHLLDVVTNEDVNILDKIKRLVIQTEYFMKHRPEAGESFYGVGGLKIFRDLVYDVRGFLPKDHAVCKNENLYDFPKRAYFKHFIITLGMKYMTNPKRYKKYSQKINDYFILNYQKQIDKY